VTLATLTLPAGTYLVNVSAYLTLEATGGPFDTVACGLDAPRTAFAPVTAFAQTPVPISESVEILDPEGRVTLQCVKGQPGSVRAGGTVTAVKVGTLHLQ
jgi:hypothetical protein